MSQLNLKLKKSLFTPKFLPYMRDYSHRWEVYYGSAGSSKSYSIVQKLIIRACDEQINILVARRFGTTLRNSCFSLFKEVLDKWQLTQYVKIRETDMRITFPNGSTIIMIGLDDEAKLLSLNNISCIWVEEATEANREILEQLNLRMRGSTANQQIILSFNPVSKANFIYDFVIENPPADIVLIHSTYKDNPFLPQEYIEAMKDLEIRNPAKARVYCKGEWGVNVDGLVFTNWEEAEFDVAELTKTCEHRAGLDFGFNDPTAIVDTLFDKDNRIIYVFNERYAPGLSLDQIYQSIVDMKLHKSKIYCDSASPREIDFLRTQNVPAYPCVKGAGSVEARISFLQNNKLIVKPQCENVVRELQNFSFLKDKNGNFTDKTTHEFSHSLDALGYAYSDIYTKRGLKTMDKSILGL